MKRSTRARASSASVTPGPYDDEAGVCAVSGRSRVTDGAVLAREAVDREPGLGRQRDGQARRRTYGDEGADTGRHGLLHELEAGAPAHHETGLGRWVPREEPRAGHLVHRVVAAHVLANDEQVAVGGEEAGGVHPARAAEDGLSFSEAGGQPAYDVGVRQRPGPGGPGVPNTFEHGRH